MINNTKHANFPDRTQQEVKLVLLWRMISLIQRMKNDIRNEKTTKLSEMAWSKCFEAEIFNHSCNWYTTTHISGTYHLANGSSNYRRYISIAQSRCIDHSRLLNHLEKYGKISKSKTEDMIPQNHVASRAQVQSIITYVLVCIARRDDKYKETKQASKDFFTDKI